MAAALRWYVVHTHQHAEETALRNLLRQGFLAFLPQYRKRRRHARRIDWVRAPLFPRYLFVAIDLGRARWRAISSTLGVSHLICRGEMPLAVPRGVVEEIQARAGEDGLIPVEPRVPYRKGDALQVRAGALAEVVGLFECATDADRVILLLDMLGRQVRVAVPLADVAPVG